MAWHEKYEGNNEVPVKNVSRMTILPAFLTWAAYVTYFLPNLHMQHA